MIDTHNSTEPAQWQLRLRQEVWENGKVIELSTTGYRHKIVAHCYPEGRQTAVFANGEGNYGAYIELVRTDSSWISHGNNIVPVLPDGRLIMIIEQRPAQGRFNQPTHIRIAGQLQQLSDFGPYSSLEFPGGAMEDETITAGFLRELTEETGTHGSGVLYRRLFPVFPMGSDMAIVEHLAVIYLQGMHFDSFTKSDGGLHVLALTPQEVASNIWEGNILSGQAALLGWAFYQEVESFRKGNAGEMSAFISMKNVALNLGK